MPRIRLYVNTGFAEGHHEDFEDIDDSEWAAMSEEDKQKYLDTAAEDFMGNCIDYGAHIVE